MRVFRIVVLLSLIGLSSLFAVESPKRLYVDRFDPADHPDHLRYAVVPPDWETFGGKTNFICCRSLGSDYEKTYKPYADAELGTILLPHQGEIFRNDLAEFAEWVKRNNLFLFDYWGYVPGSGSYGRGDWVQNRPGQKIFETLETILGDHWLGMDNGEQDGRYIGRYAPIVTPITQTRFDQYMNFQRHFERLGNDLGNRLATLVSLNFGHYFLKEGIYTLIGAETAQALPNSQVYYSWIRGAGKQYGVLWFGNASVYNRWGYKAYPNQIEKGTSLNLLKRLMYSHILYNSAAVGFENGWFCDGVLTPIGKIQRDAARWLKENGDPGTMITPVALLSDYFCGWSFPQHHYSTKTYRVWGNLPYDSGDYLNNNLLELIYPGYQSSSYYHDETGFLSPTPYGDSADSLLSDAPVWLLNRYPLLIVADRITGGDPRRNKEGERTPRNPELIHKLTEYVGNGGRVLLTAGNLEALDGFLGMKIEGKTHVESGAKVEFLNETEILTEHSSFDLLTVTRPQNSTIMATCQGAVAAFETTYGTGSVLILNTPFGISDHREFDGPIRSNCDVPLPNPYPFLKFVGKIYRNELDKTVLFEVGDGLGSIVCRKRENVWTVGVFNNNLSERPFAIRSRIGKIVSLRELPISVQERNETGFLPEGFESSELGTHSETTIAGADVRIFEVTIDRENLEIIQDLPIPSPPKERYLELLHPVLAKEEILSRPTFFEHHDGIVLDWRYFEMRSNEEITREAGWLNRHRIKIIVDFSSGINLFPDLRLHNNDQDEYDRSMHTVKEVIEKARLIGAETILLSVNQNPENNSTPEENYADNVKSLRQICELAAEKGMKTLLRVDLNQPISDIHTAEGYLKDVDFPSLKLAVRLCLLEDDSVRNHFDETHLGMIFATGKLNDEENDTVWTTDIPIDEGEDAQILHDLLEQYPDIPRVDVESYQ